MAKGSARKPVKRDAKGRVAPGGGSLNPGGVPRLALEMRRLAMQSAGRAIQRAAELLESKDAYAVDVGLRHILGRSLGKESASADLPDDTPPSYVPSDTMSLLNAAKNVLAANLGRLQAQVHGGQPLSDNAVASLSETARSLRALAEEEREVRKLGGAEGLTDDQLKRAVLEQLTPEELMAELSRKAELPMEEKKR